MNEKSVTYFGYVLIGLLIGAFPFGLFMAAITDNGSWAWITVVAVILMLAG